MSKMLWRYIEVTYELPGAEREQWRAAIVQAGSPDAAFECARADTLVADPTATNIEVFVQRALSPARAGEIRQQFEAGTWDGWPFDPRDGEHSISGHGT